MPSRDILQLKESQSNTVNSRYSRNDSLNVSTRKNLVEVTPMIKGEKAIDRIEYTRIRDHLNIKTLREIAKHCCLLPVDVQEDENYFSYQYPRHERICISKKTWRIYAEVNNEETRYQAFMLLRFLAKFGYVEGFKRIQRRKSYNIGW